MMDGNHDRVLGHHEVEFHVGRREAGEDWEIRDVFGRPEDNLPELKRLLGHVVHP